MEKESGRTNGRGHLCRKNEEYIKKSKVDANPKTYIEIINFAEKKISVESCNKPVLL
jgi:hypothetical protein